jgi:hypothetical protein
MEVKEECGEKKRAFREQQREYLKYKINELEANTVELI